MDKQIKKKIDSYTAACNDLAREFTKRIGLSWDNDCGWVGKEVGGILIMGDYFVGMQDIIDGLRLNATWDDFLKWYDYRLDVYGTDEPSPNFKHWLKGCPRATGIDLKAALDEIEESQEMFLKSINNQSRN